jgi:Mg-chelatase subunit ChlI
VERVRGAREVVVRIKIDWQCMGWLLTKTVAGEESSRAAYLKNLERELDTPLNTEDDEKIDKEEPVVSVAPSKAESRSSTESGRREVGTGQRVIRFDDGDTSRTPKELCADRRSIKNASHSSSPS